MTPKTKQALDKLASYFYLQIEYASDLHDNVPGFLQPGPDPRYIVVNARKPACDQALTIAHELAHYVLHPEGKPARFLPRYLDPLRQFQPMEQWAQATERFTRQKFNIEWQADLWAFILLWQIGAVDELLDLIQLYPGKTRMFWYSWAAVVYANVKQRITALFSSRI